MYLLNINKTSIYNSYICDKNWTGCTYEGRWWCEQLSFTASSYRNMKYIGQSVKMHTTFINESIYFNGNLRMPQHMALKFWPVQCQMCERNPIVFFVQPCFRVGLGYDPQIICQFNIFFGVFLDMNSPQNIFFKLVFQWGPRGFVGIPQN